MVALSETSQLMCVEEDVHCRVFGNLRDGVEKGDAGKRTQWDMHDLGRQKALAHEELYFASVKDVFFTMQVAWTTRSPKSDVMLKTAALNMGQPV